MPVGAFPFTVSPVTVAVSDTPVPGVTEPVLDACVDNDEVFWWFVYVHSTVSPAARVMFAEVSPAVNALWFAEP